MAEELAKNQRLLDKIGITNCLSIKDQEWHRHTGNESKTRFIRKLMFVERQQSSVMRQAHWHNNETK